MKIRQIHLRPTRLGEQSLLILEVMCELLRDLFLFASGSLVRKQMAQWRAATMMLL